MRSTVSFCVGLEIGMSNAEGTAPGISYRGNERPEVLFLANILLLTGFFCYTFMCQKAVMLKGITEGAAISPALAGGLDWRWAFQC